MEQKFEQIINNLIEGNSRFVLSTPAYQNFTEQRKRLVTAQTPEIILLTCSDSRIAPHYIFDSAIGKLFVVRTAGNIIDSISLGSIEFAATELGSKLLIVLGHTECGAIQAVFKGGTRTEFIDLITDSIKLALIGDEFSLHNHESMKLAIELNVLQQLHNIKKNSTAISKLIENGSLLCIGAIYDIESGEVSFLI